MPSIDYLQDHLDFSSHSPKLENDMTWYGFTLLFSEHFGSVRDFCLSLSLGNSELLFVEMYPISPFFFQDSSCEYQYYPTDLRFSVLFFSFHSLFFSISVSKFSFCQKEDHQITVHFNRLTSEVQLITEYCRDSYGKKQHKHFSSSWVIFRIRPEL